MKDKYKTKEQLITELTMLRERVTELETTDWEYRQLAKHLGERVKELACIYTIAQIVDDPNITLSEAFQQVADILPSALQHPEIARARIAIGDKQFNTLGYRETKWKLSSDIEVDGVKKGFVEVCYLEQKPEMNIEPFLSEEWLLISIVAGRLGRTIERKQADKVPNKP
ncbi:hypothetical protein ACFLU9_01015 [Chloroflexota bacterium]